MDILKDSIIRVSSRYKTLSRIRPIPPVISKRTEPSFKRIIKPRSSETIIKTKPATTAPSNHERKKFQEFLKPLGQQNLKIFSEYDQAYDVNISKANWLEKQTNDNVKIYGNFIKVQKLFEQLIDLLISLTPEELLHKDESHQIRILNNHVNYVQSLKYDVPKIFFNRLPKPQEFNRFEEYIYFLTHCKIYNDQTTSSTSGLVSDMLLYTHNLETTEFKMKRNVETFNELINYYGFQKNQNLFTRHILLIMKLDNIDPNIETFNNLLKMLIVNSQIRSINPISIYIKIFNILKIIQKSGLQVNLITYERIYSCLNNIYLKERYLNKISLINLPITSNFLNLIIDDYIKYCDNKSQLLNFIEHDINFKNWRHNDKIVNKVIKFNIIHHNKFPTPQEMNDYSIYHIYDGIIKGKLTKVEKYNKLIEYYQCDILLIKQLIKYVSTLDIALDEIYKLVQKLLFDFKRLSGSGYNIMKKYVPELFYLEFKFRCFDLKQGMIEPYNWDLHDIKLNNNPYPLSSAQKRQYKKNIVAIMNQDKVTRATTTIKQRLQSAEIIS